MICKGWPWRLVLQSDPVDNAIVVVSDFFLLRKRSLTTSFGFFHFGESTEGEELDLLEIFSLLVGSPWQGPRPILIFPRDSVNVRRSNNLKA